MYSPHATGPELRTGVEDRCRRTVPEVAWRVIEGAHIVDDALEKGLREEQEDYILGLLGWPEDKSANIVSDSQDSADGGHEDDGAVPTVHLEIEIGEPEKKRVQAYAAFVTRWASAHRDVWGFRDDYLGGHTLEPEAAYAFLESPATRYFSADFLDALGVSQVGSAAELVAYDVDHPNVGVDHRVTVRFNDVGVAKTARYAPHWSAPPVEETIHCQVCAYQDRAQTEVQHPNSWPLAYRDRQGHTETVYPWPGSLLSKLRNRTRDLCRHLGWTEEQVVWLLLTGEAPYLSPLRVEVSYPGGKPATIKMEAAAWLPAEVLAKTFRNVQDQILTEGSARLPARSLDVCAFVERNIQDANKKSVWPDLWRKWNSENPEEKRYESFRGIRQAYIRNMPKVMQSYEWPSLEASPAAEKRSRELRERMRGSLKRYGEKHD